MNTYAIQEQTTCRKNRKTNDDDESEANGVKCRTGWISTNDSRSCYLFSNDSRDWTGAQSECLKHGGSLTEVETNNELIFLNHQVRIRSLDYWIGGTDNGTEDIFRWEPSGHPFNVTIFNVTHWGSGEPNNLGNIEHCVDYYQKTWNDAPCDTKVNYICEIKV